MHKLAVSLSQRIRLLLCLLAVAASVHPMQAAADEPAPGVQVAVLATTEQQITVQATIEGYTVEPVIEEGETLQRIVIPGTQQTTLPGAPQLPSHGVLLGVPTTAGVTVQVLEAHFTTRTAVHLAAAPPLPLDTAGFDDRLNDPPPDAGQMTAINTTDAFYPGPLAELGEVGNLREQPVVQVQFYPVQYNPHRGEVRLYHRLVVQLTWRPVITAAGADARWANSAYDALRQRILLNPTVVTRPPSPVPPIVTAAAQNTGALAANSATQRLKVGITEEGLYKLTPTDLINAGFDPNAINPQTLKLHNGGSEIAISVSGSEDGRFDGADMIIFYGQAYPSAYSTTNIYWLSAGGEPGRRITERNSAPIADVVVPDRFLTTLHAEEDTVYWQTMPGSGEDRWFWDKRLSPNTQEIPTSRTYTIRLSAPIPTAATATLRVRLKGYTGLAHRTRLYLNNTWVDEKAWQGQTQVDQQATVDQALLKEGDNVVRVEAVDSQAVVDQLLVNWIELEYWARYVADNNRIWFHGPAAGSYQFELTNFTDTAITLFDITDATTPVQLRNSVTSQSGRRYKVNFSDTAQTNSRYVAWVGPHYLTPVLLQVDEPSTWRTPGNGADMLLITHEDFYASALVLADFRRSQGLRVAVIKVGDLYDEFTDGHFSPVAIQQFVAYAYTNWQAPAPTYVLLLGDANQDYKDNLRNGTRNFVPSFNIDSTLFGEVSSDNRFVTVSGNDLLPDLFIGRLPAQSQQEAQGMVDKIMQYEQQPPNAPWQQQVLLVSDDDSTTFQEISQQVAATLPYYYRVNQVAVGVTEQPHATLLAYLRQGHVLVNYAGHGEFFAWGGSGDGGGYVLHETDVAGLANGHTLPIITVANCLNGFFAGPHDKPALAETFLRHPTGGAVAMWAPTSLGYPTGHKLLLEAFYRALFVDDRLHLGAATTQAQVATVSQSSFWRELIDTYVLFGDPATKVAIPTNFPYIRTTAPAAAATEVFLDQPIKVTFHKPMNPESITLSVNPADVTFVPTWNADQTEVTFTHANFGHGKRYEFRLSGQDQQGNELGVGVAPNPWTVVVTTDQLAPSALITAPTSVENGSILTTQPLTLFFSEGVRPTSVTYAITPYLSGSLQWTADGQRADFVHERFVEGERYTFTLLTATDRVGNKLEMPQQASFTVGKTLYTQFPLIAR